MSMRMTADHHQGRKIFRVQLEDGHSYSTGQPGITSIMAYEESGEMVLTAAGDRVGFVVFGACTIP